VSLGSSQLGVISGGPGLCDTASACVALKLEGAIAGQPSVLLLSTTGIRGILMELFSAEFFSALLAIIVIDLVLAGDNAIVIALAARNLPEQDRTRAIVWGTVGAIVVRAAMTMGVVWLLKIPGLMFIGGVLLAWIAIRLIAPSSHGEGHSTAATSFWGAMKTIVIADAVMGVDNVLAVAGAAHGSFVLVVLGLLISIPIVVSGSRLVLKLIERFPSVIFLGGGILAFTAAKMVLKEPLIQPWIMHIPTPLYWLIVGATVVGTLWIGVKLKRRADDADVPA
jgi:YjbE family integral membrane protein